MAKKFYNYQSDTLGNVPGYITLRRNSVAADYQIAADGELKFLRYLSASASSAKAASYNEIPCSGVSEAYADIEDIDSSNPTSARLVLFASDSPDNEYGVYNQISALTLYRRVNGSFTNLGTVSVGISQNAPQRLLLKVSPGTPNTIQAKVWRADDPEPDIWSIETTDGSLTLTTGWTGHVGFATGDEVRYLAAGFGTDGDPAPREPVGSGATVDVETESYESQYFDGETAAGALVSADTYSFEFNYYDASAESGASISAETYLSGFEYYDGDIAQGATVPAETHYAEFAYYDGSVAQGASVFAETHLFQSQYYDGTVTVGSAFVRTVKLSGIYRKNAILSGNYRKRIDL